jgi:hypothetical protein
MQTVRSADEPRGVYGSRFDPEELRRFNRQAESAKFFDDREQMRRKRLHPIGY